VLDRRTSVVNGINQQGRPFSGFEELCAPAAPIEDLDPDAVINSAAARETDELLIQLAQRDRWTFLRVRSFELVTGAGEAVYEGPGPSK